MNYYIGNQDNNNNNKDDNNNNYNSKDIKNDTNNQSYIKNIKNIRNKIYVFLPCRQRPEFVSSLNDSNCDGLQLLEGIVDRKQRLRRHQVLDVLVDGLEVHPRPQFELTRPEFNLPTIFMASVSKS